MKKIGLILVLSLLSLCLSAQTYSKRQYRVGNPSSWVSSNSFDTKVYNVLDYGAISDDGISDVEAIQDAINAAHALYSDADASGGGTVYIPTGIWYIDDPDTLKSFVEIDISANAHFEFPSGYTGSMWFSNKTLEGCYVHGGRYGVYGDPRTWTLIDLNSPVYASFVMFNRFRDMWANDPLVGIDLATTNDGWINGNTFEDIVLWNPISGIKTRQAGGSSGLNENKFVNIEIQLLPNVSKWAIDTLTGYRNQFVNISAYDCSGTTKEVYIRSTGLQNTFLGCSFEKLYVEDYGFNNVFLNGELTSVPSLENVITTIVAGTGITRLMIAPIMVIELGAPINITANPQIVVGNTGQIITLLGRSNTNTLTLDNGDGLVLASQCVLGAYDTITLYYSAWTGVWIEISRSNN